MKGRIDLKKWACLIKPTEDYFFRSALKKGKDKKLMAKFIAKNKSYFSKINSLRKKKYSILVEINRLYSSFDVTTKKIGDVNKKFISRHKLKL